MDTATGRAVLRLLSNDIYVLTSRSSDRYGAATVTWLSQASFKPPMIMVAIRRQSSVFQCFQQSGAAAIDVLGFGQQMLPAIFTSYGGH
jgi:flavin reductase (DIM6/NTAB) family NADH-FMN oxidoreductase RutF